MRLKRFRRFITHIPVLILLLFSVSGCAYHTLNQPLEDAVLNPLPSAPSDNSDELFLLLTFSGGGTRAAALSYGVLEELRDTEIVIKGRKTRFIDEIDFISSVSGGSFTAAYYGLFGDRIFEDFEEVFLKKNIQRGLTSRTFFNPVNWVRLSSTYFSRSDLAAEYYDKYIFENKSFGDMNRSKGPYIVINSTDIITGNRVGFTYGSFNSICSDLNSYSIGRAVAASSAVPFLFSPITLKNYAGSCNYEDDPVFKSIFDKQEISDRRSNLILSSIKYQDSDNLRYIHLFDGGISDNLGVRALLDGILLRGSFWDGIKDSMHRDVRNVVIIVVNAERSLNSKASLFETSPSFKTIMNSYASTVISRYNFETLTLLKESFRGWRQDVQNNRCPNDGISLEPGSCGDISFHLIEVKFSALEDEKEQAYFMQIPTSFKLNEEQVGKLKNVGRRILRENNEYQILIESAIVKY